MCSIYGPEGGGGLIVSALCAPYRAVLVRALVGAIVLCSWVRPFTLTVALFTQVYE